MRQWDTDVIVVGSGHNGLVAAICLAQRGLKVIVFEDKKVIGGATRTEYPFEKAPHLGASTASYLLGVMPPEIMEATGVTLPLIRRNPHYFLPTTDSRYVLFGGDTDAMQAQFLKHFSEKDWRAHLQLQDEIGTIRADLAPAWMAEAMSLEQTAERFIRPELRDVFCKLVREPVESYLARFEFQSELLLAMYAVTDAFSGLSGSFGTPGTGHNFLVHNMGRLPRGDGTFMVVRGGMGTVARSLGERARQLGVEIYSDLGVERVVIERGQAVGVELKNSHAYRSRAVLLNADPFRSQELFEAGALPKSFEDQIDAWKKPGTTMKINLAFHTLPKFRCLPEDRGQFNGTIHLLPQGDGVVQQIRQSFEAVQRGELAERPTIEWYIHTSVDPSLRDEQGNHSGAFFIQWAPHTIVGSAWDKEETSYMRKMFDIAESFAPGFTQCVLDAQVITPPKIEKLFGIKHGHIHHVDNTFAFDQRVPTAWPVPGVYSCSAGCHPAGSVIGAAGYNAAQRLVRDLG